MRDENVGHVLFIEISAYVVCLDKSNVYCLTKDQVFSGGFEYRDEFEGFGEKKPTKWTLNEQHVLNYCSQSQE